MLGNARRDAPELPALAAVLAPFDRFLEAVREDLQAAWPVSGGRDRLAGAIGHALRFETWRSLTHAEELDDTEAADLMVDLARAAAALRAQRPPAHLRRAARCPLGRSCRWPPACMGSAFRQESRSHRWLP